jgi:hypothetical protein
MSAASAFTGLMGLDCNYCRTDMASNRASGGREGAAVIERMMLKFRAVQVNPEVRAVRSGPTLSPTSLCYAACVTKRCVFVKVRRTGPRCSHPAEDARERARWGLGKRPRPADT